MIKRLWQRFDCLIGLHDWTCNAAENIPPTQAQLQTGIDGFWDYATMYCKRCGKIHESRLHQ